MTTDSTSLGKLALSSMRLNRGVLILVGVAVVLVGTVFAVLLVWGSQHFDWVEMKAQRLQRIGLLAAMMATAAVLYFGALWAAGLKLRQLLRR